MTCSKHTPTTNEVIREIFLAHGFKIPPELTDMRPYVYDAARALLRHYGVWIMDAPPVDKLNAINKAIEGEPTRIGYVHSTIARGPTKFVRSEE